MSREQFSKLGIKAEKHSNHALSAYGSVDILRTKEGLYFGVVNHAKHDDADVIAEVVKHVESAPTRRPQNAPSPKDERRAELIEMAKVAAVKRKAAQNPAPVPALPPAK